jgi:hypothetical protein
VHVEDSSFVNAVITVITVVVFSSASALKLAVPKPCS